ncbi:MULTISPECIES: hypothetical protein [Streptosporangium]|uniref:ESX-1 secretion-associated protein n=1 Tax=Streptosporangium brasiliense TaxID=47480 RepID=A0ABT9R867_9ACTN|nr:hypothetical protein [Streptosporangium brasiliense]MDP9865441.1 hypothetical protein [Streptosporangium brasiliense]
MAGVDVHFEALETCRTAANNRAVDFDGLAGGYPNPAGSTDSLILGGLTDSVNLARAIDGIENEIDSELGWAATRLRSVRDALQEVETNLRTADEPPGGRR